jgi:alpha-galactosidase
MFNVRCYMLVILSFVACVVVDAQELSECKAYLKNGHLTIENGLIARTFLWNNGLLISESITDKKSNIAWKLKADQPDLSIQKKNVLPTKGKLDVETVAGTAVVPLHLRVITTVSLGLLEVKRVYRIYPGVPAIATDTYLRGKLLNKGDGNGQNLADLRNIESTQMANEKVWNETVMDRLLLPGVHWKYTLARFTDITDRNNSLVQEEHLLGYTQPAKLAGNILLADPYPGNSGLFLLKEAPLGRTQFAYPDGDFIVQKGNIQVIGLGLSPADFSETDWVKGFSVVAGITGKAELAKLSAIRSYQQNLRNYLPERDDMILMNTWGDRGQDSRISESFCLRELQKVHDLGITHFQIDDGWQTGRTSNSAFAGGSLKNIWKDPDYWTPNPERFPSGLTPVVAEAKRLGIKLGLWFNPSGDSNYQHWKNDAEALIKLYRDYGISIFKIDGVSITSKQGEINLRKFFDTIQNVTKNEVVFNLDVTAGRRFGYFYFNEYGNVFLENRYTDWANYYPHWTLRNLWQLSKYVAPQRFQIEFLNKWRNPDKYDSTDLFAPRRYPFDYLFAIALVAQPLAWMEAENLPDEAFRLKLFIEVYKAHQENLHRGQIFPIGEEPDGMDWTGFQSLQKQGGYILVFRENSELATAKIKLYLQPGDKIVLKPLYGQGKQKQAVVDKEGKILFALDKKRSFGFYQYKKL